MSSIPDNFVLQYSSNAGDIAHQGILASNITKTTQLTSTFPTTSTGDSLGHYHYTEPTTNALKLLNVSGNGIGGHQFWNVNNTDSPIKYFEINRTSAYLDTALRNTTNKTVLDMTNNELILTDALGTTQNTIYSNSILINNQADGFILGLTNDKVYVFQPSTNTISNLYAGILQQGNPSDISNLTPTYLQIKKRDDTLTSTLNNTSLNIANTTTNKTAILTDSDLTFNSVSYAQNQVVPTLIYSSPLIYADGIEPANGLAIRNTYGYSGWYFKNSHGATGEKINWYFPAQTRTETTVADLKGIAISFFNGQTVSNDDTLFLTVLTNPTGNNDYAPGFFHSSMTYVFDQAITPIANTNYQGVCIVDKNLVPFNFETQIQFEPSTVNNPRGTYSQTDTILAVVIGTNSASIKNNVELVVNKLNLIYSNFTQSYLLVPP
jgi:hypothetical protein